MKLALFGSDDEEFFDDETHGFQTIQLAEGPFVRESSLKIECMYSFRHLAFLQYSRFVPPSTNFRPITSPWNQIVI